VCLRGAAARRRWLGQSWRHCWQHNLATETRCSFFVSENDREQIPSANDREIAGVEQVDQRADVRIQVAFQPRR
jgi:hypothetical protein